MSIAWMELVGVEQVPKCEHNPAQTLHGNSTERGVKECIVSDFDFRVCQALSMERSGGINVKLECLKCNSILCLAAGWVQVCMRVFFQGTKSSFVVSFAPLQTHIHTPSPNSSALI